jgi:transitional endoplasmic reticulum ATPase
VRELFQKARASAPCIVFFDEIDALLGNRDGTDPASERVVGQFLAEMDGASSLGNVIILGATNRLHSLDPALLRSGRFERVLEFKLPNEADRLEILGLHFRGRATAPDLDFKPYAAQTDGWSGADLELLARRAALNALQEWVQTNGIVGHRPIGVSELKSSDEAARDTMKAQFVVQPEHLEKAFLDLQNSRVARVPVKG